MKHCNVYVIAAMLLLSLQSISQNLSKRLKIGDTVPDLVLENMLNYKSSTARLSDFKGKAIVLDFWNKYCKGCINAFPKLERLQQEFKNDLTILLVNDFPEDTREKLDYLFKRSPIVRNTTLPMVLTNAVFSEKSELFPHTAAPYHVWLDKDRVIRAITNGESATSEHIRTLIADKNPEVVTRVDILDNEYDVTQEDLPALQNQNGRYTKYLLYYNKNNENNEKKASDISYSLILKDPLPELGRNTLQSGRVKNLDGREIGYRSRLSVYELYLIAYELPVNTKTFIDGLSATARLPLLSQNVVYEIVSPYFEQGYGSKYNQEKLKDDLKNYMNLTANVEVRTLKAIVFYRTDQALKLPLTSGGSFQFENTMSKKEGIIIKNGSFFNCVILPVIRKFKDDDSTVVLDETGIDHDKVFVDLVIHSQFTDIPALSKELSKYGIGIKEEMRKVPVLILR